MWFLAGVEPSIVVGGLVGAVAGLLLVRQLNRESSEELRGGQPGRDSRCPLVEQPPQAVGRELVKPVDDQVGGGE